MNNQKILVVGDSFVRIFGLFKNQSIKYIAFKGATLKGLLKTDNPNRLKIIQQASKTNIIILNFGQVDLNFSVYFDAINHKQKDLERVINQYIGFVNSLPCQRKIILGPFPSPIKQYNIPKVLLKYNIIREEIIQTNKQRILQLGQQNIVIKRFFHLRKLLKKNCQIKEIIFLDLTNQILTLDCQIKPVYYDLAQLNIHLMWKPLVFNLISKLSKHLNVNLNDLIQDLDEKQKLYQQGKKARMISLGHL